MVLLTTGRLARMAAVLALAGTFATSSAQAASGVVPGHEATVKSGDGLNLRSEPSSSADVLTVADDGDFVDVLAGPRVEGGDEWFRVEYDGTVGWVAGRFLGPPHDRATVSTRGQRGVLSPERVWLPVPYASQFDGSAYQSANCGPTTLHMVLAAFGEDVSIQELRRAANRMQGTTGWYDAGVAIDVLADLGSAHGLVVRGLRANAGYDQWSFDEVRQALRNGNIVVPQVHLASLPGHERSNRAIDHYIAITGYEGSYFFYNDSAFNGGAGQGLWISEDRLALAWKRSDYPFAAFSLGPGQGMPSLLPPPRQAPIPAAEVPAPTLAPAVPPPLQLGDFDPSIDPASSVRLSPDVVERGPLLAAPPTPQPAMAAIADAVSATYDATVSVGVEHVSTGVQRISQTRNGPQLWVTLFAASALALFGARRQMLRLPCWRRRPVPRPSPTLVVPAARMEPQTSG